LLFPLDRYRAGIDVEAESRLYDDLVFVRPSFLFLSQI
jgi:hypothetical protein